MDERRRLSDYLLDENLKLELPRKSADELRRLREAAETLEADFSYQRRILQGKVDVLRSELQRRDSSEAGDLSSLIKALPDIIGGDGPGPSRGAKITEPSFQSTGQRRRRIERMVDEPTLASLPDMSLDEMREAVTQFVDAERNLSEQRRMLHAQIDALHAELSKRYKSGDLDVEDLLERGKL